jgi:hypothetical protein
MRWNTRMPTHAPLTILRTHEVHNQPPPLADYDALGLDTHLTLESSRSPQAAVLAMLPPTEDPSSSPDRRAERARVATLLPTIAGRKWVASSAVTTTPDRSCRRERRAAPSAYDAR